MASGSMMGSGPLIIVSGFADPPETSNQALKAIFERFGCLRAAVAFRKVKEGGMAFYGFAGLQFTTDEDVKRVLEYAQHHPFYLNANLLQLHLPTDDHRAFFSKKKASSPYPVAMDGKVVDLSRHLQEADSALGLLGSNELFGDRSVKSRDAASALLLGKMMSQQLPVDWSPHNCAPSPHMHHSQSSPPNAEPNAHSDSYAHTPSPIPSSSPARVPSYAPQQRAPFLHDIAPAPSYSSYSVQERPPPLLSKQKILSVPYQQQKKSSPRNSRPDGIPKFESYNDIATKPFELPASSSIFDLTFYCIDFEAFVNSNPNLFLSEVGIAKFTVKHGLTDSFDRLIDPGPLPDSLSSTYNHTISKMHGIPRPTRDLNHIPYASDMRQLFLDICAFMNLRPMESRPDPNVVLMAKDPTLENVALSWLAKEAGFDPATSRNVFGIVYDCSVVLDSIRSRYRPGGVEATDFKTVFKQIYDSVTRSPSSLKETACDFHRQRAPHFHCALRDAMGGALSFEHILSQYCPQLIGPEAVDRAQMSYNVWKY